jgi:hypothetical protein
VNYNLDPLIKIQSHQCPKYSHCNAPLCPLDPEWHKRTYLKGEAVCFYMLEAQKPQARCRFIGTIEVQIYRAICVVVEAMQCRYGPIRIRLDRAKRTKTRMAKVAHVRD